MKTPSQHEPILHVTERSSHCARSTLMQSVTLLQRVALRVQESRKRAAACGDVSLQQCTAVVMGSKQYTPGISAG
jgi:hypothetical protein